ncbi:hypothetical protein [Parasphingorhabdus sp.]|uniref:hypothetical protein n=1 Tax=Parasphingorhabdus sp. TaxID=2709688 RepID=UPI003BB1F717
MDLKYGQMENLLAAMHEIAPAQMGALRSRLKHFKRLKFPVSVNTGAGLHARYGAKEIVFLLYAFQLIELGMTPERVKHYVEKFTDDLARISSHVGHLLGRDDSDPPADQIMKVRFDPNALSALTEPRSVSDNVELITFKAIQNTIVYKGPFIRSYFDDEETLTNNPFGPRYAEINATDLLFRAAIWLEKSKLSDFQTFGDALSDWGESEGWTPAREDKMQ